MPHFRTLVSTPLPPDVALARLIDLDRHARLVPLTELVWEPPLAVGSRFAARTRIGPWRFDDPMVVTHLDPTGLTTSAPGTAYVRFVKTGHRLRGASEVTVRREDGHSRVEWRQSLSVRGLPRILDPAVGVVSRAFYRRLVTRLLR